MSVVKDPWVIYLFIYYMVYRHVKSFTMVKNRKWSCGSCGWPAAVQVYVRK